MDRDEAERLCEELAELAGKGPCRDARARARAAAILRAIAQSPGSTAYVRERADELDRAHAGWLDSEERFRSVLKGYSHEIYALIDRLHGALREAGGFRR